ncbi:heterokaryon incompatibility protein-domain-containing protein [Fusarium flagelliforme]|uniref:heterokaryon incompatibility protein-domain-containing protein n=1 Tax=Fusarium flagelliforme TaxID=2675880 RepID=UPI001E8E9AA4|nr:heterokaryon incompatibility protein-domain-containing protein [Fusarium flagelliforme]KAH7180077.1 heterokaryon incompatibility protein-domain-containing protein [Fusarium flagelliforme]
MGQKEQSCTRHDFFVQSTSDMFRRPCLSCGFVEELQLSAAKQKVDRWRGWLGAEIQPLSWPHCVQYSEAIEATPVQTSRVLSYRPHVQTSFQNEAQRESSCIRLLELSPGDRLDIHSGRPFEVWWEQETCPPYSALSYTWADENGDTSPSNLIFLGKEQRVLRITRNCDRALRSLRHKTKSRLLWVDSICINQSSASERSHQVGLMKKIYSKATTVHSYVGEGVCGDDSTGNEAMALLNDIQVNSISGMLSPGNTSNISLLNKFFARSYFARLWIVQELLLAQSITIHCGEVSLKVTNEAISQLYEQGVKVPSWVRFAGKARSNTEQAPLDLRDLLAATSICHVTDLRDKVFGLLGLISNVQASELSPDYELMVREVYIGVAAYLMQQSYYDYGIPSWVPFWDTDVPLQTPQGISKHIEQIELDSKRLFRAETPFGSCTIRMIDGWSHGKNSECDRAVKCCKMVDWKSGFLKTRIEAVMRLDSTIKPLPSVFRELYELEDGEYFTGFWNLKDGLKLAIRSLAWALKCTVPKDDVHLIRVERCTALFLAHQTYDERKYRLICSCVVSIVFQTPQSSPAEILKSDDLHHYLQFKPLTVEMIHFIANWRNQVLELARSNLEDREQTLPIEDQSCRYITGDQPETSHPSWRSWIPFLTLETRKSLKDDLELQKQFQNLVDFWHKAHILHAAIRDMTKIAFQLSNRGIRLDDNFPDGFNGVLADLLGSLRALGVAFETITGNKPILLSMHALQLLLDLLANPNVKHQRVKQTAWKLSGYPRELEGLFEDYDRLHLALEKDRLFLDQAFPLDLKDICPEYSNIKETIEWKLLLAGITRGNTEVKDISFI